MLNKLGLGLALMAAFGLMACSSSSSSDNGKVTLSCKVAKESPLTIKESAGIRGSVTIIYDQNEDGKMVVTYDFGNQSDADDECEDAQKGSEFEEVTCNGKKVVEVSSETATEKEFKALVDNIKEDCIESDGQTVTIDKEGYIVDDDEDDGDDGDDGDEGPATASSCDFDVKADVWEYSFEYEDEVDKSKGSVRYEFDGKDYTVVRTTKSTSKDADLACTKEAAASYNDEYNTTNMSKKTEASCEGKALVLKTTDVYRDYEEEFGYTKQNLVATVTASCRAGY